MGDGITFAQYDAEQLLKERQQVLQRSYIDSVTVM